MTRVFIAMCVATALISPAMALDTFTAGDLAAACEEKDAFDAGLCIGYAAGFSAALTTSGATCSPPEVTLGQLGKVVAQHLREHPEQYHLAPSHVVKGVLMKAFPCVSMPLPTPKPSQ
jgi:Rap1a immunity proteins